MSPVEILVSAQAPAKVNLHLGVGQARPDGYHHLATVFQALSVTDTVSLYPVDAPVVEMGGDRSLVAELTVDQTVPGEVPTTPANLAWRAVTAVARCYAKRYRPASLPAVGIHIDKKIPVAGGMAGGSADAGAALVAADAWLAASYGVAGLPAGELHALAARLGADVPFSLVGGTALGTGRGDELTTMLSRGTYYWAMITSTRGLSTPTVFHKLDELRAQRAELTPHLDTSAVAAALLSGDSEQLAAVLHNDLLPAALSLRPDLRKVLQVGVAEGALGGTVSGSGPTCALLCRSLPEAAEVGAAVAAEVPGASAIAVSGPAGGPIVRR